MTNEELDAQLGSIVSALTGAGFKASAVNEPGKLFGVDAWDADGKRWQMTFYASTVDSNNRRSLAVLRACAVKWSAERVAQAAAS